MRTRCCLGDNSRPAHSSPRFSYAMKPTADQRDHMSDDNIIKFERRKPKREPRSVSPGQRKALIWLAVIAGLALVWAYYQFIAPPSLP